VNHEAKLKGVAKPSDYTQKPGLMNKVHQYPNILLGDEPLLLVAIVTLNVEH